MADRVDLGAGLLGFFPPELDMMQFSGLETMTISILGSMVTAAVVRVWMGGSFISKDTCSTNRSTCGQVHESTQGLVDSRITAIDKGLQDLAKKTAKEGDLMELRAFLKNIGSNFILKGKKFGWLAKNEWDTAKDFAIYPERLGFFEKIRTEFKRKYKDLG